MLYLFFVSFVFYITIDYLFLYDFFDMKIFLKASGSKLRYVSGKRKMINIKEMFFKFSFKKIITFLIYALIGYIINFILFHKLVTSNFLVLNLGYKKIELVSTFEGYWTSFIKFYYIVYSVFICISFYKLYPKILLKLNNKTKIINSEVIDENKIYLGTSEGSKVFIDKEELYKNVLITGSVGTGKTAGAINAFCEYMLKKNISGLIIDIKGNYVKTVDKYIQKNSNYEIIVLSEETNVYYNPINSEVRSLEMANRLRKVIELISPSNSSDSYWLDKVENVLHNLIILIKYVNKENLDLKEIHLLTTDDDYLKEKLDALKQIGIKNIKDIKKAHEINNVIMFFSKEYFNLDKRVSSIIKSEITRLTIPFITEYDICLKFGTNSKDSVAIDFQKGKPKVIVLSINMSKNFLIAKMLATFIKLEFQANVLSNILNPIETFCICDEYQEFANIKDSHFLSLSREAKCMNIYSMQSYSSLINILKDEQASKVIIQNMVNKIWFRNDDNYTVEEVVKQIGREKKLLKTTAISEGADESRITLFRGLKNKKSNISETISYSENNDYILNSNIITRELEIFEALVLFGKDGKMEKIKRVKFVRRYENENCKNDINFSSSKYNV